MPSHSRDNTNDSLEIGISGLIVLLHSTLIWLVLSYELVEGKLFPASIASKLFSSQITIADRIESVSGIMIPILIVASSILAPVGFMIFDRKKVLNRPLVAYIIIQLSIGILLLNSLINSIGLSSQNAAYAIGRFAISYVLLSIPLCIFLGIIIHRKLSDKPSLVDGDGRLFKCVSCGYDLHATTGSTCPECGASVIADDSSTTAD